MKINSFLLLMVLVLTSIKANSQIHNVDSAFRRLFAGSSFFILGNFASSNKPGFVQVNFGYRITTKDVISMELKTWKYAWPLGIPYEDSFVAPEEKYPGYIREYGIAFVFQRFWWKGIYTSVHAMNGLQKYVDENNITIQYGDQLF